MSPRSSNVVDEEYDNALHTKSFIDIYSKVHDNTPNIEEEEDEENVRPIPEILDETTELPSSSTSFKHNNLLLDFLETTSKSTSACATLLYSIACARSHHRSIHRLLFKLSSTSSSSSSASAFSQISSHLELDNPLSQKNLSHFHFIHSLYPTLIQKLTSAHGKIKRRLKLIRAAKKAAGVVIISLVAAVAATAVIIATHGAAAAMAAAVPAVFGIKLKCKGWVKLEREKARVDAAAKGAYIVGRDLDTMSQMLRRVHDEVEHWRDVARMVVRNREWEMVREVVKEMKGRRGEVGLGLDEQLKELEEHVYLCLITISRSRRLVAHEMRESSRRD